MECKGHSPKIIVSKFGKVDDREVSRIIDVMEECYGRLTHDVALVDLYVFERSHLLKAFLTEEAEELGAAPPKFDELFFGMHDAWRGIPRIIFCLERMKGLPELVQVGGIRHEVGHSILHGDLQYYLIPLSSELSNLVKRFNLPSSYATDLLYLTSIAVKDYEVSRLLKRSGYVEDQAAYAKHLLTPSEDMASWEALKGIAMAKALFLASQLKSVACAIPFLLDERFSKEAGGWVEKAFSYMPRAYYDEFIHVAIETFEALGEDTLDNIESAVRSFINRLIEPILKGSF